MYQILGVTSLSNKFPSMLTMVNNIFLLAWTENTIYEFNSKDKNEYYSKGLQNFTIIVLLICSLMLPAVKVYFELFIDSQYNEAINLVPIMFVAMIFNALASFLGTIYTASMKTKEAFYTTIIAAILNVILDFILIPTIGIFGYGIANAVSYIIFYLIRKRSINKIVKIKEDYKKYIIPIILLIVTIIVYYITNFKLNFIYEFLLVIIIFICYFKLIKDIILKYKQKKEKNV